MTPFEQFIARYEELVQVRDQPLGPLANADKLGAAIQAEHEIVRLMTSKAVIEMLRLAYCEVKTFSDIAKSSGCACGLEAANNGYCLRCSLDHSLDVLNRLAEEALGGTT